MDDCGSIFICRFFFRLPRDVPQNFGRPVSHFFSFRLGYFHCHFADILYVQLEDSFGRPISALPLTNFQV